MSTAEKLAETMLEAAGGDLRAACAALHMRMCEERGERARAYRDARRLLLAKAREEAA